MDIVCPDFKWKSKLKKLDLDNVTSIVIHHTASKKATVEEIHQWHLNNGWSGIGYNEFIAKDGTVYICRGDYIGSATQGQNSKSYNIAVEGDYDLEMYFPEIQKQALVERIKFNKTRFPNLISVFPHSYFSNTNCPGINFPFAEILKRVEVEEKIVDEGFLNCVELLNHYGFLKSPDYWVDNEQYKTEYVRELIKTFANYVYTQHDV